MKRQDKLHKRIMKDTLKRIRKTGLRPINITYPDGYFVFQNEHQYSMMHFELMELPDFQFAVWYVQMCIGDEWLWTPTIFAERKWLMDKFKPSRAEWSPLYNNYVQYNKHVPWEVFWDTIAQLPELIKTPWVMVGETKEEYEEMVHARERKFAHIAAVKKRITDRMVKVMEDHNIPLMIIDYKPLCWDTIYFLVTDNDEPVDVCMSTLIREAYADFDDVSSYDFDMKCGLYRTKSDIVRRAMTCKHAAIPRVLPLGLHTLNFDRKVNTKCQPNENG